MSEQMSFHLMTNDLASKMLSRLEQLSRLSALFVGLNLDLTPCDLYWCNFHVPFCSLYTNAVCIGRNSS